MRPNATTCCTWPAPPPPPRDGGPATPAANRWFARACTTPWTRSSADPRWSATDGWTSSRPTCSAEPCYVDAYATQPQPVNIARYAFLSRNKAEQFYPDWDRAADQIVGILRAEAGRDPHNPDLQDLIGQLSTLSEEFRTRWGAHDVRRHDTGEKHFHHHIVGDLHLQFESTDLPADPGWKLQIYTAEPASTTADALRLLASWAATREQESAAGSAPPPSSPVGPALGP